MATLQAHLAPEARKLAYFMENDSKIEASLDPFWVPWAPLGSTSEPPGHKLCQKLIEVEICGLRGNECFPMVKRYIFRVWGAGVLQMSTFRRTWEAPGAQSGAPGPLLGMQISSWSFECLFGGFRPRGRGGRGGPVLPEG